MEFCKLGKNQVKYCKIEIKQLLEKIRSLNTFCSKFDETTIPFRGWFSSLQEQGLWVTPLHTARVD